MKPALRCWVLVSAPGLASSLLHKRFHVQLITCATIVSELKWGVNIRPDESWVNVEHRSHSRQHADVHFSMAPVGVGVGVGAAGTEVRGATAAAGGEAVSPGPGAGTGVGADLYVSSRS
jgi:hypothetical protein